MALKIGDIVLIDKKGRGIITKIVESSKLYTVRIDGTDFEVDLAFDRLSLELKFGSGRNSGENMATQQTTVNSSASGRFSEVGDNDIDSFVNKQANKNTFLNIL